MLQFRLVKSNIITFCHEFQRQNAKMWQTDLNKFDLQFVVNEWSKMKMEEIYSFHAIVSDMI